MFRENFPANDDFTGWGFGNEIDSLKTKNWLKKTFHFDRFTGDINYNGDDFQFWDVQGPTLVTAIGLDDYSSQSDHPDYIDTERMTGEDIEDFQELNNSRSVTDNPLTKNPENTIFQWRNARYAKQKRFISDLLGKYRDQNLNSEFSQVIQLDFLPARMADREVIAYLTKINALLRSSDYVGYFSIYPEFRSDGKSNAKWNLELSNGVQYCNDNYENRRDFYLDLRELYNSHYNCAVLFQVSRDENVNGIRIPQSWLAAMISRIRLLSSVSINDEEVRINLFYDQQTIFYQVDSVSFSTSFLNYLTRWIRQSLKFLYLKGTIILDAEDDADLINNFNLVNLFADVYSLNWRISLIGEYSKFLAQLRMDRTITIPFFFDDLNTRAGVVKFLTDLGVVFFFLGNEIIIQVSNQEQIQNISRNLFSVNYSSLGKYATEPAESIEILTEDSSTEISTQVFSSASEASGSNVGMEELRYKDLIVGERKIRILPY